MGKAQEGEGKEGRREKGMQRARRLEQGSASAIRTESRYHRKVGMSRKDAQPLWNEGLNLGLP